jgi:hypothetical protein
MALVALLLRGVNSFVAAPVAIATYVAALWLTGGLEPADVEALRHLLGRRFARFRRPGDGE